MRIKQNFIYKTLLVAAIIFIADRLVGVVMNYEVGRLKNGNLYELRYKLFDAHPAVAVIGSSRANHHYNIGMMDSVLHEKVMNYGFDGTNVFCYYVTLKTLLQSNNKPRTVIVDIKPGEFDFVPNANMFTAFYPLLNRVKFSNADLAEISPYEKIKLFSYGYRYNNQVLEIISATHGTLKDTAVVSGFLPLQVRKGVVLTKTEIVNDKFSEKLLGYFNAIIQLCRQNNVHLIVCTSPYYHTIVKDASLIKTEEICRQSGVTYISYINNKLHSFSDSLFADEAHLNSDGADIFTKDLLTRLAAQ